MARSLGLVLDLSFAGFVAVTDGDGNALAARWRAPGERHDAVSDWVESCLGEAQGNFSDLIWICVGIGPGSFTGIRIAMAFAQGLAMPGDLPLYGFTSFGPLLLSAEVHAGECPVAAIPANSGRLYAASGLKDPGALIDAESLSRFATPETVLIIPAVVPAMDPVLPKFSRVYALEDRWNVPALVRHARDGGKDASRPYYLQLSAAEEKLGAGAAR